jgi:hypothetical protein
MNAPETAPESTPLRVRRGRVESVDLYEVKDIELDLLEKGSPASFRLNFAVFLLSLAFSCSASLCTATFTSDVIRTFFIVIAVVGALMGAYLLIVWWRTRTSISGIVRTIRDRMEPPVATGVMPTPKGKKQTGSTTEPSG